MHVPASGSRHEYYSRAVAALAVLAALAQLAPGAEAQACPPAPAILHSRLRAVCSQPSASAAIGCSVYALCSSASPQLWPALCGTWRIMSSLCADDAAIKAAVPDCQR